MRDDDGLISITRYVLEGPMMTNDYLRELRYLGVTARLKRLSDALSTSIKELYRSQGFDIEPSWHLVFLYVKRHPETTVTQLADALKLSQPAMTKMLDRMAKRGYLRIRQDGADGRRRCISLSSLALARLPEFERVWGAGENSIRELLAESDALLQGLEQIEDKLQHQSFAQRVTDRLGDCNRERQDA